MERIGKEWRGMERDVIIGNGMKGWNGMEQEVEREVEWEIL